MNFERFDTTEALALFATQVQRFLDEQLTHEVRSESDLTRDEHHPGFFKQLGARGWLIPEASTSEGGANLSWEQIEILDLELTRRHAPVVNQSTSRMTLPAIRRYASDAVRDRIIREVTSGETALTLGYTEPSGGSDIAHVKTRALRQEDGSWIINGAKVYTTGAHHSRYVFLLANTDPQAPKGRGLTMFALPLGHEGVEIHPIETLGERTNSVFFSDVRLSDDYRLGDVNDGWRVLQGPLDAEHGVGMAKGQRSHIDIAVLYARRLANALAAAVDWVAEKPSERLENPTVLRTLGETVLRIESGLSLDRLEGRVNSAQHYINGTNALVELAAPESLVADDSPGGRLQRAHRASQVSATYGGTVEVFRNLIARQLGLPRPAYTQ